VALVVPGEDELDRLVLPGDAVEVEEFGEELLRGVREANRSGSPVRADGRASAP